MTSNLTIHLDQLEAPEPVLVHGLTGFMDAGSAGALVVRHLIDSLAHRVVAEWNIDGLFDYRARRPRTIFNADRYTSVELPRLRLLEIKDATGRPFLLLEGVEPDLGWQSVVADVIALVDKYRVSLVVGAHAIPWPAPHTRPMQVTAHGTDPELLVGNQPWVGELTVPGSLTGFLEYSLGQAGHKAVGYAAHVPHYLVNTEYVPAAMALLSRIEKAAGLALGIEALLDPCAGVNAAIDEEVASQPELQELISGLEQQYEMVMRARDAATWSAELMEDPSVADAVEQFLAELDAQGRGEA